MVKERLQTGQSRVEFITHKELIKSLKKQGYTLTAIFKKLKKEYDVKLSYTSLARLLRADEDSLNLAKPTKESSTKPKICHSTHDTFIRADSIKREKY